MKWIRSALTILPKPEQDSFLLQHGFQIVAGAKR
jgi:hypothetical protein